MINTRPICISTKKKKKTCLYGIKIGYWRHTCTKLHISVGFLPRRLSKMFHECICLCGGVEGGGAGLGG